MGNEIKLEIMKREMTIQDKNTEIAGLRENIFA